LTSLALPTSVRYDELRHDSLNEGALYGQATERLFRGLELTFGGRVFGSNDQVTSLDSEYFGTPSVPYAGRASQFGFAPKIVLADHVTPWLLVYAQADEGYRAPGINTASASNERFHTKGGAEPLRVFEGDQLWSEEVGAKVTALDGRLRLDVALYNVEWRNVQSDQLLPSGIPYTANVGHALNLGVEVEADFRTGGLELRTEMLFNEPELDKANLAFPILSRNGLGAVPDESFGLSAHYKRRLWDRWSWSLDTNWAYVGGSNLTLNIASLPQMGNYVTGRVATTLSNDHWRVTFAVDNPADAQGNTFAYGNPFTVRFRSQVTPLRPRTLTLGVAVSY
jgi:iron complex outermembrane receptor protein